MRERIHRSKLLSRATMTILTIKKFVVRVAPRPRQPSPFIRAIIFIYVRAQLYRIRRRRVKTIGRDVCRRSLSSSSQTDGNFNRFFSSLSLSISLSRSIPHFAKHTVPRFLSLRFLQSVLSIPVKALTGLATTLFATEEIRVSQE